MPLGDLRRVLSLLRGATRDGTRLGLLAKAATLPKGGTYDAIIVHFGSVALDIDLLRRLDRLRGPLCVIFHGFDMTRYLERRGHHVYDELLARAEWLLPVSERWRERLIELGAEPQRIRVHHMGVQCEHIAFEPRRWRPGQTLKLLSVARLVEKKGLQHAIPAVAALAAGGQAVSWDVIGDGPMRGELHELARKHGLPVRFHGALHREDVSRARALAHVMLAPSTTARDGDQEGIPVAIMEAMAAGLLVVATRHSGIPELVRHAANGFLAREGNADDLRDCMRLACREHDRWAALQRAARDRIERDFNQATLNESLVAFLSSIARHEPSAARPSTATAAER